MDSIPIAALAPIVLLYLGLVGYCLWDLTRGEVRYLPKWAWAVVVIFFTFGGIAYLIWGREQR